MGFLDQWHQRRAQGQGGGQEQKTEESDFGIVLHPRLKLGKEMLKGNFLVLFVLMSFQVSEMNSGVKVS